MLIDTEGLVWLIDFADVTEGVPVGIDIAKLFCSVLFMYVSEEGVSDAQMRFVLECLRGETKGSKIEGKMGTK